MSDYQPKTWKDYPNTTTPITAYDLNRIDSGVKEALEKVESVGEDFSEKINTAKSAIIDKIDTSTDDIIADNTNVITRLSGDINTAKSDIE